MEEMVEKSSRASVKRERRFYDFTNNGTIAAGIMVLAAVIAVICANTAAYEPIQEFLETELYIGFGTWSFSMTFEAFVNDGLMAIFFFSVGIELKYEITVGELREPRKALLPIMAAVGGAAVPAAIYAFLNRSGYIEGWAIPMATDIAFALGVLSLLGDRVPSGVRVFFSTLAIADDLISIVILALFYGESIKIGWLIAACVAVLALMFCNYMKIFWEKPYWIIGIVLWFFLYQSGIHATLAGVITAFCVPGTTFVRTDNLSTWLRSKIPGLEESYEEGEHILSQEEFTAQAGWMEAVLHFTRPPLVRLEEKVSTPVDFFILPLFAFVNAQVRLVGVDMVALITSPVTLGVYFGMVLGKPIGIVGMTFLLVKTGICELPEGVGWKHIIGVGILGGIGFTMSILVSGLAFTGEDADTLILNAKAAVLAATVTAAVVGLIYMTIVCKDDEPADEAEGEGADEAAEAEGEAAEAVAETVEADAAAEAAEVVEADESGEAAKVETA